MKKHYLLLALLCLSVQGLHAQITSSAISGQIVSDKKEALVGAIIQAIHQPTGTIYTAEANLEGQFNISNINPGGPYTIKISYVGFTEKKIENVFLQLGNTSKFNVDMQEDSKTLEEVVVKAPEQIRSGAATSVSNKQLTSLPTLTRGITDFTRLTPQASNNSFGGASYRYNNVAIDGAISNDAIGFSPQLGGQSPTSGMPGSSTRTQPISFDAIDQIQVRLTPYDVKLGNFLGGSVNAITRRGTNEVTGSVYGFGRNAAITGVDNAGVVSPSGQHDKMPNSYYDYQTGFRVGLPLVKNKLFFFTNEEITRSQTPQFYGAGQTGSVISVSQAQQITDSLESKHFMNPSGITTAGGTQPGTTYNPGTFGTYNLISQSNKFFNRVDWNINDKHQLMVRLNVVDSKATNLDRSQSQFEFGNYDWMQRNLNVSGVAELKSRFSNNLSNNLILGYTYINDKRDPTGVNSSQTIFPQIEISNVSPANNTNGSGTVYIGSNRQSGIFNMTQKTFEITDNFNLYWKKHAFTFGTHNELYSIDYGFVESWNGRIQYNSLAQFFASNPSRIRAFYENNGNNSQQSNLSTSTTNFNINLWSAYAQDEWSPSERFKLTYGLRVDLTQVPTGPNWPTGSAASNINLDNGGNIVQRAPNNGNEFGTSNTYGNVYAPGQAVGSMTNKIFGQPLISPRLGFNWDLSAQKDQSIVLRGGTGVFTGRIPFAWLGYAYYNNGTSYGSIDVKNPGRTAIPTDPTTFPTYATAPKDIVGGVNVGGLGQTTSTRELDLVSNNFKMPQNWKSNLAVDFKLLGGYKLTLEGLFSQVIQDVQIQQVNLKDSVRYASYDNNHQQGIYLNNPKTGNTRINQEYSAVYMLTNTNKGYRYSFTAQVQKTYKFGLDIMAAYTYGQSWDVVNGVRNAMENGWQLNQALNPNNPQLSHSNFDIRDRIISNVGYKKSWNDIFTSYISMVFSAQSGTPYSWVNSAGNASLTNSGLQTELAYIPNIASSNATGDIELLAQGSAVTAGANTGAANTASTVLWQQLNSYVSSDSYLSSRRGNFTQRNEGRTPWNFQLDLRLMQDFNFFTKNKVSGVDGVVTNGRKHTIQITFDIINFTNLLNKNWGRYYYVSNTYNNSANTGLVYVGHDTKSGKEEYTFAAPTTLPYNIDPLLSRWQGQLGVRYLF